jgi:hypothetical protein
VQGFYKEGYKGFAKAAKKLRKWCLSRLKTEKGQSFTVMEHWAESLLSEELLHNFRVLLSESHAAAEKALAEL